MSDPESGTSPTVLALSSIIRGTSPYSHCATRHGIRSMWQPINHYQTGETTFRKLEIPFAYRHALAFSVRGSAAWRPY